MNKQQNEQNEQNEREIIANRLRFKKGKKLIKTLTLSRKIRLHSRNCSLVLLWVLCTLFFSFTLDNHSIVYFHLNWLYLVDVYFLTDGYRSAFIGCKSILSINMYVWLAQSLLSVQNFLYECILSTVPCCWFFFFLHSFCFVHCSNFSCFFFKQTFIFYIFFYFNRNKPNHSKLRTRDS